MAAGARLDYERDKDDPLNWQMRQENDESLHRQRWWWQHCQNGTLKNKRQLEAPRRERDERQRLSREAEQVVDALVRQMG